MQRPSAEKSKKCIGLVSENKYKQKAKIKHEQKISSIIDLKNVNLILIKT